MPPIPPEPRMPDRIQLQRLSPGEVSDLETGDLVWILFEDKLRMFRVRWCALGLFALDEKGIPLLQLDCMDWKVWR